MNNGKKNAAPLHQTKRLINNLFTMHDAVTYMMERYDPEKGDEAKAEVLDTWKRIIRKYKTNAVELTNADRNICRALLEFTNHALGAPGHIDGVAVKIMAEMQAAYFNTFETWATRSFPDFGEKHLHILAAKLSEKECTEVIPGPTEAKKARRK